MSKEIIERVGEDTAKYLFLEQRTNNDYIYRRPCWEELGASAKQLFYKEADLILSHPNIAIVDEPEFEVAITEEDGKVIERFNVKKVVNDG